VRRRRSCGGNFFLGGGTAASAAIASSNVRGLRLNFPVRRCPPLPSLRWPEWTPSEAAPDSSLRDASAVCVVAPLLGRGVGREELLRQLVPLRARLGLLLRRGRKNPDGKAGALCRELTKWWAALWTFARVDSVVPTNQASERALRPAVLWRKGSFGSDSAAGSRFAERLLTVVASCRQQGRPLLAFLVAAGEAAWRGSPPPSLLSSPQGS
jgi:hypothetical protein